MSFKKTILLLFFIFVTLARKEKFKNIKFDS